MSDIRIVARPHPLKSELVEARVPSGATVNRVLPGLTGAVSIQWNGSPLPRSRWDEPLTGGELTVVTTPRGDEVMGSVLQIAIAAAAVYATTFVPVGWGALGKFAVGAAVPVCGRLEIGRRTAP